MYVTPWQTTVTNAPGAPSEPRPAEPKRRYVRASGARRRPPVTLAALVAAPGLTWPDWGPAVAAGLLGVHQRRYEQGEGSSYLLTWVEGVAVGHVLVTTASKYLEVRHDLGLFPEVNGLDVAHVYRRRGVGRALVTVGVVAGGVAVAVTAGNTYTGCLTSTGTIVKVAIGTGPKAACAVAKGQKQISWNEQGQQGEPGLQGPAGPQGPAAPVILTAQPFEVPMTTSSIPNTGGEWVDIATFPSYPGYYSASVSVSAPSNNASDGTWQCRLSQTSPALTSLVNSQGTTGLRDFSGKVEVTGTSIALQCRSTLEAHTVPVTITPMTWGAQFHLDSKPVVATPVP